MHAGRCDFMIQNRAAKSLLCQKRFSSCPPLRSLFISSCALRPTETINLLYANKALCLIFVELHSPLPALEAKTIKNSSAQLQAGE